MNFIKFFKQIYQRNILLKEEEILNSNIHFCVLCKEEILNKKEIYFVNNQINFIVHKKCLDLYKSINNINELTEVFQEHMIPLSNKINEFINSDMYSYNEMLQWNYDNNNLKEFYIYLSSKTETFLNEKNYNEKILETYLNNNNAIKKVNLDEEMINLLKYQKSYEAAAKVIKVSEEILQTTINLKG